MTLLKSNEQSDSKYKPASALGTRARTLGYRICCEQGSQGDDGDGEGDHHEIQLYKYLQWA